MFSLLCISPSCESSGIRPVDGQVGFFTLGCYTLCACKHSCVHLLGHSRGVNAEEWGVWGTRYANVRLQKTAPKCFPKWLLLELSCCMTNHPKLGF